MTYASIIVFVVSPNVGRSPMLLMLGWTIPSIVVVVA